MVIIVTIEVELEQESTTLTLCTPISTIDPLRHKLAAGFQSTRLEVDSTTAKRMEASVRQTISNMSVQLATGTIKTKDFLNLKPGDVISMETNPTDEALLMVEGEPKFYGYGGTFRGNRAIRITRPIPQRDLINYRNRQELIKNGG